MLIDYGLYLNYILLGLFSGIGVSLGNYLMQRSLIRRLEDLEANEKLNRTTKK